MLHTCMLTYFEFLEIFHSFYCGHSIDFSQEEYLIKYTNRVSINIEKLRWKIIRKGDD